MGLFDFLWRNQHRVEAMIDGYLAAWAEAIARFFVAMAVYREQGLGDELDLAVVHMHRAEHDADDLRRSIEYEMFGKGLLPESRSDLMAFVEEMDRIVGEAQGSLFLAAHQRVALPPAFHGRFRTLLDHTKVCLDRLLELAGTLFERNARLVEMVKAVDDEESACDHVEQALLKSVFSASDLDGVHQILLRDLITKVAGLSDLAERMADRISVISLKRRV